MLWQIQIRRTILIVVEWLPRLMQPQVLRVHTDEKAKNGFVLLYIYIYIAKTKWKSDCNDNLNLNEVLFLKFKIKISLFFIVLRFSKSIRFNILTQNWYTAIVVDIVLCVCVCVNLCTTR
jgi:hypothetical protein